MSSLLFGYFLRTMITMAVISYNPNMDTIPAMVADSVGWEVVWGPVELKDEFGVSYSRAFIARNDTADGQYAVVIRGTNPVSWTSWTQEDFDIGSTVPFDSLLPASLRSGVPDDALISQGTFNGTSYLVQLRDSTGRTMAEFLSQAAPRTLFVTGHSLGGTLTPPLFAYLNEVLGDRVGVMLPLSFAGLTPGDAGFNSYLEEMIADGWNWRVHNTLDIAPSMWGSFSGIENIYAPWNLYWDVLEMEWLTRKFQEAAGIGYAQPAEGALSLAGQFCHGFLDPDGHSWTLQVMHQHHGSTYEGMIYNAFPATAGAPQIELCKPLMTIP